MLVAASFEVSLWSFCKASCSHAQDLRSSAQLIQVFAGAHYAQGEFGQLS